MARWFLAVGLWCLICLVIRLVGLVVGFWLGLVCWFLWFAIGGLLSCCLVLFVVLMFGGCWWFG